MSITKRIISINSKPDGTSFQECEATLHEEDDDSNDDEEEGVRVANQHFQEVMILGGLGQESLGGIAAFRHLRKSSRHSFSIKLFLNVVPEK